jgi:hypothetical protein
MEITEKEKGIKIYCTSCKKNHIMTSQPCPSCNGRGGYILMPKSEKVRNECMYLHYKCDGCEAYEDHLR